METKELLGKKLTKALYNVEERINNAFLKDFGDSDWDWSDELTREQYDALNELSEFFFILNNWHLHYKDSFKSLRDKFPKLFEDM